MQDTNAWQALLNEPLTALAVMPLTWIVLLALLEGVFLPLCRSLCRRPVFRGLLPSTGFYLLAAYIGGVDSYATAYAAVSVFLVGLLYNQSLRQYLRRAGGAISRIAKAATEAVKWLLDLFERLQSYPLAALAGVKSIFDSLLTTSLLVVAGFVYFRSLLRERIAWVKAQTTNKN